MPHDKDVPKYPVTVESCAMKDKTSIARGVLHHVEALTRHRDVVPLNISVLASIRDLLNLEDIRLFEIMSLDGHCSATLAASTQDGDIQCHSNSTPADINETPCLSTLDSDNPSFKEIQVGTNFFACFPVILEDKVTACFEVKTPTPLSVHQMDIIEGVIGVYRNFLRLLKDSQHDELTGLLNRKTFDHGMASLLSAAADSTREEYIKQENDQRTASGDEFWLAVIDIDFFKRINDNFGHLFGDEVLILMANLMRKSFRQQDKLYRFGGEEFVVLMRHISFENVMRSMERFRLAAADYPFPQVGQVTVSIGIAPIKHSELSSAALGNADEALYYAKEHGRNQVQSYTTLVESGQITVRPIHEGGIELF